MGKIQGFICWIGFLINLFSPAASQFSGTQQLALGPNENFTGGFRHSSIGPRNFGPPMHSGRPIRPIRHDVLEPIIGAGNEQIAGHMPGPDLPQRGPHPNLNPMHPHRPTHFHAMPHEPHPEQKADHPFRAHLLPRPDWWNQHARIRVESEETKGTGGMHQNTAVQEVNMSNRVDTDVQANADNSDEANKSSSSSRSISSKASSGEDNFSPIGGGNNFENMKAPVLEKHGPPEKQEISDSNRHQTIEKLDKKRMHMEMFPKDKGKESHPFGARDQIVSLINIFN
ncbi:unnamed protein product [Protopolystoma xenopodis]|uniref:Uncharacterized protein n=1 Tax=Protopolystoma xenopodis TaxID=117903 RepID=A0A3S5B217_9PLAT|nr:unnamed protein product [Protopolystoma xenopodis]